MKLNLKARSWHTWASIILALPILIVGASAFLLAWLASGIRLTLLGALFWPGVFALTWPVLFVLLLTNHLDAFEDIP